MDSFISGAAFVRQSDAAVSGAWHTSLGLYSSWMCTSPKPRRAKEPLHLVVESFRPSTTKLRNVDFVLDTFYRPRFVYFAVRERIGEAWRIGGFAGAFGVASSARSYLQSLGFMPAVGASQKSSDAVTDDVSSLSTAAVPSSGLQHMSADALATASRIGMALDVLSRDIDWANLPLENVYRRIATPVGLGQSAVLIGDNSEPLGFASWAWIQPAYHKAGPIAPESWRPHEWFEGPLGLGVDFSVSGESTACRESLLRLLPQPIARDFVGATAPAAESSR